MKKTFAALFFALLAAISSNTAALHCNSAEEAMIGDINGDALVDGRDATALLTAYASESAGKTDTLSAEQRRVADVNRDDIADGRD
ncbi:MAG: glycoside hydrolase family 3, partial [Ruminococcus sp.]|nr:glycoside hydrolase family 3 [Ruminococcus sp.]